MLKKSFLKQKINIREARKSLPNSNSATLGRLPRNQSPINFKEHLLFDSQRKIAKETRKKIIRKSYDENTHISHIESIIKSQNASPNRMSYQNQQQKKIKIKKAINSLTIACQRYKFIYRIGFGGLGKVWKVEQNSTLKPYAMKCISKKKVIMKESIESIMNQRVILSQIEHPFIINMKNSFQDRDNLYLVMDYLRGGDLRYHICYKQSFSQTESKFIIGCIILGLQYIHQNHLIHRDIKPENIVFEENGYARITDFGIAKFIHNKKSSFEGQPSGTPGYMAPEVICKDNETIVSDYFSLGIIAYELMFRKRPYVGNNRNQIRSHMLSSPVKIDKSQIPNGWSQDSIDFIMGLTERNPDRRLGRNGIESIKNHKWMKNIKWEKMSQKRLKPPFIPYVVCEGRQYLNEIESFVEMDEQMGKQSNPINIARYQQFFMDYDYQKIQVKMKIKSFKSKAGLNLKDENRRK